MHSVCCVVSSALPYCRTYCVTLLAQRPTSLTEACKIFEPLNENYGLVFEIISVHCNQPNYFSLYSSQSSFYSRPSHLCNWELVSKVGEEGRSYSDRKCCSVLVTKANLTLLSGLGGLVVSMLASGTRVRGFETGRSRWGFRVSE